MTAVEIYLLKYLLPLFSAISQQQVTILLLRMYVSACPVVKPRTALLPRLIPLLFILLSFWSSTIQKNTHICARTHTHHYHPDIFFYFITIHEETRIILHILYASNQIQRNDLLVPI